MIYTLQIYRGLAALFIVLVHSSSAIQGYFKANSFTNIFQMGGHLGVNFFFVLSGFIMCYLHCKEMGLGLDKAVVFIEKRIVRIIPLYWIFTFSILPILYFVSSAQTSYMFELEFILKSLFLIPQEYSPILHMAWTLVQEFLFYSIFFIMIFNKKIGLSIFIVWLMGIIVMNSNFLGNYSTTSVVEQYLFQLNNILFFFGIFTFFLMKRYYIYFQNNLMVFILGNIILFIAAMLDLYTKVDYCVLIYGVGSMLIIANSKNFLLDTWSRKRNILLLLGNASFSIYLSHYIFVSFFMKIFNYFQIDTFFPTSLIFIFVVVLVILPGILLYKYIEKPTYNYLKKALYA